MPTNPGEGLHPPIRFTVQCLNADACTVFFEPEGAHVDLERGEVITVEMSGGMPPNEPEIAYVPEGIIVGAWAHAITVAWNASGDRLDI